MNSEWPVLYCSGCGAEIVGAPFLKEGKYFCCEDCAEGKVCSCALLYEDDRRIRIDQPQDMLTA